MEQYHTILRSESEIFCDEVVTRLEEAGIPVILTYVTGTSHEKNGLKIMIPSRYEQKGRHALLGLHGVVEQSMSL